MTKMNKKQNEKDKHNKSALEVIKSLYWLWFTIITIFIICTIIFILLYKYFEKKYKKAQVSCGDQFNINDELAFDSFDESTNTFCMKAKQYKNQTICFQLDKSNNVIVKFGTVLTKNFGNFDKLPDNEDDSSSAITIAGQKLLVFKYPFSENTICIRNLSDSETPGRLCYNFDKHIAFVSAPTDESITSSN